MRSVNKGIVFLACLVMVVGFACPGFANKASVTIEVPETAEKGAVITIRANVSHSGNSFLHYTDWVYVKINGVEVLRLEYSPWKRPEAGNFSRDIKHQVAGPMEITAEAHCILHGSAGIEKKTVTVK